MAGKPKKNNITRLQRFTIEDKIYPCHVHIIVCKDRKKMRDFVKRNYEFELVSDTDSGMADASFAYNPDNEACCIIWLEVFDKNGRCLSALTHELQHYLTHVMEVTGVKGWRGNDEQLAYLYGFYIEEFINAWDARVKRAFKRKMKK